MMDIGFTGTRDGLSPQQYSTLWDLMVDGRNEMPTLHHGDCVGADAEVHEMADSLNWRIIVHPPAEDRLRAYCPGDDVVPPKTYLERNRDIVNACDRLIACPKDARRTLANGSQRRRGGTWYTIRYAAMQGKPITIIWPDGSTA